jgi:CcmD family protein
MIVLRRVAFFVLLTIAAGPVWGQPAQTPSPAPSPSPAPAQQSEFVPVSELPPQDQLPAAPLLITAYGVVWVALFGYVFSVARRLRVVQREVERLESDLKRGGS